MIERWRRLVVEGADRVPAEGGALLVANRAGVAPLDVLMIARALPRDARFLAADWAFGLPWFSIAVRRAGGVPAVAANAERLLGEGELVIASVDGPRGDDRARYRVGRIGGDLAALALRARAPVVPVGVIGAEDLAALPGPLAGAPVPSRWRIEFGEPLDLRSYGDGAAGDRGALLEVSETIRDRIQTMVYENLVRREGAFL
jgi:1-acyl-sn-glycerol-3-phosphate acyltransferase